jgi:hypothetical protein
MFDAQRNNLFWLDNHEKLEGKDSCIQDKRESEGSA